MKCLNIKKASYGDDYFNSAETYNNIGIVYHNQGRLDQALEIYAKCLNIKKAHYGEKNINLTKTYNNIGVVY